MSGGSFNYAYSRVQFFAEDLRQKLDADDYGFQPATIAKLTEIQQLAEKTAALMRAAEWLYSGDTGDESFMREVAQVEAKYAANELPERRMVVCSECGNKRCPRAAGPEYACTNSNAPGQIGIVPYPDFL